MSEHKFTSQMHDMGCGCYEFETRCSCGWESFTRSTSDVTSAIEGHWRSRNA